MSDSTSNLDLIAVNQSGKETTSNALDNAGSPATYFGIRKIVGLTVYYYGGVVLIAGVPTRIPNGTLTLDPSDTCYMEHTVAGVVSFNTSGFTAGSIPDAKFETGASGIDSYEDFRTGGGSLVGAAVLAALAAELGLDSIARVGDDIVFTDGVKSVTITLV